MANRRYPTADLPDDADNGAAPTDLAHGPTHGPTHDPEATPADLARADRAGRPDDSLPQVVWRRRRWLVGSVAVALAAGAVYLGVTPRVHTAVAKLHIAQANPNAVNERDRTSADDREDPKYLYTQREVIESSPVLLRALQAPGMENMALLRGVPNRVSFLKQKLDVSVGEKNDVLSIAIGAPSPEEAKRIVDAVGESYQAYQSRQKRTQAGDLYKILKQQRDAAESDLSAKASKAAQYKASLNTLGFSRDDGNFALQRLTALSNELTAAQLETVSARTAFEEAMASTGVKEADVPAAGGGVALSATDEQAMRADLFALRQQLDDLNARFLPNHPAVRRTVQRIRQLEEAQLVATRQRWVAAKSKYAGVKGMFEEQQAQASKLDASAAAYQGLQNDVQRLKTQIDSLDTRMNDMALAETAGALNIEVVEPATLLDGTKPEIPKTMALALLAGLILGTGLAVGREWTDPLLGDAGEIRGALGLPVLGEIPDAGANRTPEQLAWASHVEPSGALAAGCREVLVGLRLGSPNGSWRTLMVTSPAAGDGKSVLAANLATGLAKAGRNVVVVDANLTRPALHRTFDVNHATGLTNLLGEPDADGGEHLGRKLDEAVQPTAVEHLDVLPAGPYHPYHGSASDLLNGAAFDEVLDELTRRYDHVIIDADEASSDAAQVIAGACDRTLIVVRGRRSNRRQSAAARDGLMNVGANLAGIVVNGAAGGAGGNGPVGGRKLGNRPRPDRITADAADATVDEADIEADRYEVAGSGMDPSGEAFGEFGESVGPYPVHGNHGGHGGNGRIARAADPSHEPAGPAPAEGAA